MGRSRSSLWLYGAIGLLGIFIVASVVGRIVGGIGRDDPDPDGSTVPATPQAPPNSIAISIASSNTKQTWLHQAVDAFNAAAAVRLEAPGRRQARLRDDRPGDDRRQPGGLPVRDDGQRHARGARSSRRSSRRARNPGSPSSSASGTRRRVATRSAGDDADRRADAPGRRDVAVPRPGPRLLADGRARLHVGGRCAPWPTIPTAGRARAIRSGATFKFGYGYFGESNSGTLAVISMCTVGLGKTHRAGRRRRRARPAPAASSSPTSRRPRSTLASPTSGCIDKMVTRRPRVPRRGRDLRVERHRTNKASGATPPRAARVACIRRTGRSSSATRSRSSTARPG